MCRLFFSYNKINNEKSKEKTLKALLYFFDTCEKQDINDGYGLSWLQDTEPNKNATWNTIKNNVSFHEDIQTQEKIKNILLNARVILAHARNINKIDKSIEDIHKENIIQNTHPIIYKNDIFMHHGDLLLNTSEALHGYQRSKHIPLFRKRIQQLTNNIDTSLIKEIKGTTDSEIILHLFLSVQKKNKQQNIYKEQEDLIISSFMKTIYIIEETQLENISNIFYVSGDYILIAKINKNKSNIFKKGLDIFYKITENNIIVTSIRLNIKYQPIKDNNMAIINYKQGLIKFFIL